METRSITPVGSKLTAEEEEALASQVMEIIGGMTGGPCQSPEELEERYLWSLEEGDDSVFYSDEDQGHQDLADAARSTFDTNACCLNEPAQPMEEDDTVEKEKGTKQQTAWTEETQKKLQPPTAQVISATVAGGDEFDGSCGELGSTRSAEQKVRVEEDVEEVQAPGQDAFHVYNIPIHERLSRAAEVFDPLKLSSNRQPERDGEGERDHGFPLHASLHQSRAQAYFTLPLMKKAPRVNQTAFDHLSSAKYSTTSYRRIRRGNTRQRIEEFEFIMKNQ